MIQIKQPAMVAHSHDVPGYRYKMKYTWEMMSGVTGPVLVDLIRYGARRNRLENVVINCHGLPGKLYLGGSGTPPLDLAAVNVFSALRRLDVGTIWLVACRVAANRKGPSFGPEGLGFCSFLAQMTGCRVIAADVNQSVERAFYTAGCPWGYIDDYEGVAYRFLPTGGYTWYSYQGRGFERGQP